MAEEKVELRDLNFRHLLPWTELFRGFQVALDPKKLLLAAAGIVVMAFGWWVLSAIFYSSRGPKPDFGADTNQDWSIVKEDRDKWNLLYKAAAPEPDLTDPTDLADSKAEYQLISEKYNALPAATKEEIRQGKQVYADSVMVMETTPEGKQVPHEKKIFFRQKRPYGAMRTWPWMEDRGPNPYLLVTGQEGNPQAEGTARYAPWEKGQFVNWFVTDQAPVLIEPLRKFLSPVIFLLHPRAGFWNSVYFSLILIWTLATWALFGGAITRMAVVQVARKEKIGMNDALRFTLARYLSFFSAPLFPLIFVLVIVILLILFGFLHMIGYVGDVVDGIGWPMVLLAGIIMAVILVGLVGWPMMYATISAEGSDSFDALSRSYSYVYQCPWHYLWYSLVAIAYGAVLVFFVGFMGSLMVYLGKWGVSQTPGVTKVGREPSFLFVHAPVSFGWRELLLQNAKAEDGHKVVGTDGINQEAYNKYLDQMPANQHLGAWMVAAWLYLVFLMVIGFGYSYFWSSSSIIYLLMRRKVDDTEFDEVYLEEDETEDAYSAPPPLAPATSPAGSGGPLTMVESPTLKTATTGAPSAPSSKVESIPPGDGNPPE